MGVQVAESSNLQHKVWSKLLESADWDGKTGTQPAESSNLQHTRSCKLLDSATCIPMQLVGFRLTHLYYVDQLRRVTLVLCERDVEACLPQWVTVSWKRQLLRLQPHCGRGRGGGDFAVAAGENVGRFSRFWMFQTL